MGVAKIVLLESGEAESGELLTLEELGEAAGVHPELLLQFVHLELITPHSSGTPLLFEYRSVLRARKALRLHHDLGVNYAGIALVLDLLERIDALERELQRLRG